MKRIKSKEPKPVSLILTALSGIFLGAVLGIWILITKPVNVVAKAPEPEALAKPGDYTAFYVPGPVASAETPNLRNGVARIQRRTNGPVSFSAEEINYFFAQQAKEAAAKAKAAGEEGGSENAGLDKFNVRIAGDKMVASFRMVTESGGERFEMVVQGDLSFENTDAGPELSVSNVRINSLPAPGMGGMFRSKLAEAEWDEDLVEMWQNIRRVEVESDKLITEVGLRRA